MKKPFDVPNNQNGELTGLDMMGDNIRNDIKYCGENVVFYPLAKLVRGKNAMVDDYSRILDYTFIDAGKSLKIGKHCMITWHTIIEGGASTTIGDRVFIGPGTKILTSTYALHGFFSAEFIPDGTHEIMYGDIEIETDAYVGANCTVMPGVKIGEGAVVGANSLVTKDLEPWGIYVGSPCKKIGERKKPSNEIRKKLMESFDWSKHF
ncbi:galactoside O-acetyltransferase [Peptostreptococcaceae bacterium pGA-8]|nr:galactoside O-acetyltransferase [Peptostreptococcaceae bacterium pGA-8]